jgi:formylglycine-generating enzyme required for sulfatase activity
MTKLVSPTRAILPGSFLMGACDEDKFANDTERPRRRVEIVRPFEIGIFPVTVEEWASFDPEHDPAANDLPVVNVSHHDIARYLAWLNESHTGRPWRLPTEEEWEYACRADTESIFNTGDQLDRTEANFLFDESIERVGPGCRTAVATYPPNPWGFHDFHGNVAEWTSSLWQPDYRQETASVPHRYTIRGGAWDYLPRLLRSSWRDGLSETTRRDNLGFRLARDAG